LLLLLLLLLLLSRALLLLCRRLLLLLLLLLGPSRGRCFAAANGHSSCVAYPLLRLLPALLALPTLPALRQGSPC
jgi:hypothetical protein